MPIKVSSTAPRAEGVTSAEGSDASEALLSDFASGLTPETRAALRAALRAQQAEGVSVELDPALDGHIELDPALAGPIEPDPLLESDFDLDASLGAARRKASTSAPPPPHTAPPDALQQPFEAAVNPSASAPSSEKIDDDPTLRAPHALVVSGAMPVDAADRPPQRVDEAVQTAAREADADAPPIEEPMIEDRDLREDAQPTEEEAEMVYTTTEPAAGDAPDEAGPGPSIASVDEAGDAEEPSTPASDPPVSAAPEAAEAEPDGRLPTADDLFEAVPESARHFMALLEREGTVLMPRVMEHLGLVRPKGVGGVIEPIQRVARLIGVELPFVADFDPSGYKRWVWCARPLAEVPDEVLEPIPAPPPQAKKPKKKKADRSQYKRAWKRSLGQKKGKRGAAGKGRKAAGKGRRAGPPRPEAENARPARLPTGHRDESTNSAPRARGAAAAPPPDARRRRYDRPMPEVFRRANRPASRPAPPRREEVEVRREEAEPRRPRFEERPRPAAARPAVPRLDRAPSEMPPPVERSASESDAPQRRGVQTPEERLPLPRSGVFRRRTVGDTDVPVVVIRRRKR